MDLGFDFDFRTRPVRGEPGRAVEQVWFARGTVPYRSELIAPTGSTVAILILGDSITQTAASGVEVTSAEGLVIGPHTAPITNAPYGETFAVGIVTTAVGCEALLGHRPAGLRGRIVDLATGAPSLVELRAALAVRRADDPEALLDAVEHRVAELVNLDVPGLGRVEGAVASLVAAPRRSIQDLAQEVGVSHAHLDREFSRIVGLRPRELARLLLLRRLIEGLDPLADVPWASVAADGGWSDQAHFTRDFTRHTGLSPRRYLQVQRSFALEGNAGPGFSPDVEAPR
ncbi:helix-turn-helix domain-containing protein [Demequina activiva]|uniref:HTH araC/xylS-type domain-containing protein n=1 Tax=Demequina activiva TaxID=1582364 RepID=A0A919Q117_9MICO|nr:helix-turn-helix domain-containing protein [Demequina activiva]GIG54187.1 hypothetical protein Dac01nite_09390 [Demequina activiva]